MSKITPDEKRWTPTEIAVFHDGLMKVKAVYPKIMREFEKFIGDNQTIKIESLSPDSSSNGDPWPVFYTFVPSYSSTRPERLIESLSVSPDTPTLAIHPLLDGELESISSLAGRISDIGLNVKPWKIYTEGHQIAAMRYKLTPYYQREKGQIVGAFLKPKNS